MLLGVTLVVDIIAFFDVFLVVDYVIVAFLIVVPDHIELSCGQ